MKKQEAVDWLVDYQSRHDCHFKIEIDGTWSVWLIYSGNECHDVRGFGDTLVGAVTQVRNAVAASDWKPKVLA